MANRQGHVLVADLGRYAADPVYIAKLPQLQDGQRLARQLYTEGRVKPHISAVVPFDAAALQRAIQDGASGTVGKVVVKVQ